ncbi:hypothetical protein F5880DRAFT_1075712 [Lentinula raphanica]|nr:hypothetical protein F5880DRAFT_1075712 [Lentinula raphanica]
MLLPRTVPFLILAAAGATAVLATPVLVDETRNIDRAGNTQNSDAPNESTRKVVFRRANINDISGKGKEPKGGDYVPIAPRPSVEEIQGKFDRIKTARNGSMYELNKKQVDDLYKRFEQRSFTKKDMDVLNEYLYLATHWDEVQQSVRAKIPVTHPSRQLMALTRLSVGKMEPGDLSTGLGYTQDTL